MTAGIILRGWGGEREMRVRYIVALKEKVMLTNVNLFLHNPVIFDVESQNIYYQL